MTFFEDIRAKLGEEAEFLWDQTGIIIPERWPECWNVVRGGKTVPPGPPEPELQHMSCWAPSGLALFKLWGIYYMGRLVAVWNDQAWFARVLPEPGIPAGKNESCAEFEARVFRASEIKVAAARLEMHSKHLSHGEYCNCLDRFEAWVRG